MNVPIEPFKLVTPLDSSPFSHFLPKSMTKPEWPTMDPEQPPEKPSPPPKKRKRAEIPQWREYPKRARKEITYADAEDSDDSAFYGSDDNDEDVAALKQRAKADRPLPKRKIFPFLSLPRELRDMIYEHAVGTPAIIVERPPASQDESPTSGDENSTQPSPPPPPPTAYVSKVIQIAADEFRYRRRAVRRQRYQEAPIVTALLGVCRQIHAEAAPVLYSATRFEFYDPAALHTFVAGLSRPTRALLRDVKLKEWFYRRSYCRAYNHAAFAVMAEGCTGVRSFRFCTGTWEKQPKWEARRIYRYAYPWLDSLVAAKEGGVAEVLGVLAAGVERWGEEWRVGNEKWELFSQEFVRLMALGTAEEEGEEDEEEEPKEAEEDEEYSG